MSQLASVNSLLEGGNPLCEHQQEEEEDDQLVRCEAAEAAGEVTLRRILRLHAERRDAVAWKRGTNRLGYWDKLVTTAERILPLVSICNIL